MIKKTQQSSAQTKPAVPLAGAVKESAQQIWLAGLGAFAKAQEEGGKVFDALVKEGMAIQRKTQSIAEEKISEATSKMADMASGLTSKATGITSMATGQWDKLENIFEARVAKALSKLGVPSSKEIAELTARVEALNLSVQKLAKASPAAAVPRPKASAKTVGLTKPATKPAAKRAATGRA
ncbi:MAG: hypothetical protein RLZZ401_45 [Pseudomonadota bacterium]